MMDLLIDGAFKWHRPRDPKRGFRWEGEDGAMRLVRAKDAEFVAYTPDSALFRTFAALDGTPKAVLRFANKYGLFTRAARDMDLDSWRQHITEMHGQVALADALDRADVDTIKAALAAFPCDATFKAAMAYGSDSALVDLAVKLLGNVFQTSVSLQGSLFRGRVQVQLLDSATADLLGFMRFQIGYSLIQHRQFQHCVNCGEWFRVQRKQGEEGTHRTDKKTCSPSCRVMLAQQRRARAIQLKREGWTVKKIAKKLGSTIDKIQQWIQQAKGD
jgi:hypothetical protein